MIFLRLESLLDFLVATIYFLATARRRKREKCGNHGFDFLNLATIDLLLVTKRTTRTFHGNDLAKKELMFRSVSIRETQKQVQHLLSIK